MRKKLIQILKSTEVYKDLNSEYVKEIISTIFEIILVKLHKEKTVKLKGFGTLLIKTHNIKADGLVYTIKFKASKHLISKINK